MKKKFTLSIALLLFCCTAALATNHTVNFGGFFYSPDTLYVIVGDQVTWSGSFSSHPLASTSVPQGATTFSCSTGTSFTYSVTMPGIYNYECSLHGFKGVLIASAVNKIETTGPVPGLITIFPNPATTSVTISVPESLTGEQLTVTDVTGRVAFQSKIQNLKSEISMSHLSAGIYFVTVRNRTQKLIIQK